MGDTTAAAGERRADVHATATSRRDVGTNMGAFAIAQIAMRFVGLFVVVGVARLLSKDDFGRYSVALALASMLTLPVESGMGAYLVREGTQKPDRLGLVLGHVVAIQTLTGLVAVGLGAIIGVILGYDDTTLIATLILTVSAVLVIITRSFLAVLMSLKKARAFATYSTVQSVLLAVLTMAAALLHSGPVGLGVASLIAAAALFPSCYVLMRRHWHAPIVFRRAGMRETLRVSTAYSAAKLGISLLTYVDAVMMQAIKGNAAAAQYSAAYRLLLALRMFPLIYNDALSQPAAHLARTDRAGLTDVYNRAVSQLLLIGLPIAVGGALLGEPLMTTIFSSRYSGAGTTASLLLATLALSFPYQVMTVVALAVGLERQVAWSYGATVVVNVLANAFLIPAYGPKGAAVAMLISTPFFVALIIYQLAHVGVPLRLDGRHARTAMATAVMGVAVLVTRGEPLVVPLLAGVLTYILMVIALRALQAEDLDMLPGGRRLAFLVRQPHPSTASSGR